MQITKVELEDIKSYDRAEYEFEPGVIAISGPNGAGKTTILEAIAWALFDQLPYKKEDFLRRGAKKGSVRVSFLSALDGREYTVYRDTSTGYYIYDPITKMKLVEQKSQVGVWLRQHLAVDAGTDLKSLFTSTIGVPQGTFTVDFAEQPAKRKIGFDKVLKVDEYNRSSDELRAVARLVESRDADLREEIARFEGEVSRLDDLFEEKTRQEANLDRLNAEHADAERELESARIELDRLTELQRTIERLTQEALGLEKRVIEGERLYNLANEQVIESRTAADLVGKASAGFASYNEATQRLAELEPEAIKRDAIKKDLSEKERELSRLEGLLVGHRERLRQIESDKLEYERLAPLAAEQEGLEARRAELQTALGEAAALRRRAIELDRELNEMRGEYASLTKQVDEAGKLTDLAERAPALEESRRAIEIELREARVQLERLSERQKEIRRLRENIAKLTAEISTIEKEIAGGAEAEALAATLPDLEIEHEKTMEEIAHTKASIDREQKLLSQISGGLCPLLSERCLNMKAGEGLDQYFKIQVGNERGRLKSLEEQRKIIQANLVRARAGAAISSKLGAQRIHHSRFIQELEIEQKTAARVEAEISSVKVNERSLKSLTDKLEQVEQELHMAQSAKAKVEGLALLQERLEKLKGEGAQKRKAVEELQARLATLDDLQNERVELESRLEKLEDPRGRRRALEIGLAKEKEIREGLAEVERREFDLAQVIKLLAEQLESFAGLDERIASERAKRAASENDHKIYIENKPVAQMLGGREAELDRAQQELESSRNQMETVATRLQVARGEYDEQAHARLKLGIEDLINKVALLNSEINGISGRLNELNYEIARLSSIKEKVSELIAKRARYQSLLGLSEFIRDLLKKAGPFITEAHLQSISIEANQLYRDITGNPMVSLRWDTGYEVILEEEGHERSFASLSGGEQMAAALAVRLALLKELSDMRIAFFDEPTTNMDEERRRNLAQQIGRIKDFDQLFVISHDDAFEGFTDRVISVKGAADGSR